MRREGWTWIANGEIRTGNLLTGSVAGLDDDRCVPAVLITADELATLERERDEARREVERLREALALIADLASSHTVPSDPSYRYVGWSAAYNTAREALSGRVPHLVRRAKETLGDDYLLNLARDEKGEA